LNARAGEDYSSRKVLALAPTGKAAYHVKGTTIHSGLKIPANQRLEHKPLPSATQNTLRTEISSVKLIFIDEISMVGFKLFNCINQRLMDVMQSQKRFGGISMIAVGDLFQLKPVMDSYIFTAQQWLLSLGSQSLARSIYDV
jgi:ATP-dependent exoDNAse (exonuclease V) alpha subunit